MSTKIVCPQCQGSMHAVKKGQHNVGMQVLGVIVFIVGLVICFTGIGAIFGIPLMIGSLFMGYKKRKVMKCDNCGYFYDVM